MCDDRELGSKTLNQRQGYVGASLAAAVLLSACGSNTTVVEGAVAADAGAEAGEATNGGVPIPTVSPEELDLDTFGVVGNRYWLVASEEQVMRINALYQTPVSDRYAPPGVGGATFVDPLLVTRAGNDPQTADLGKVQVRIVGNTTARLWTPTTLPNFKLDADEF